MALNNEQIQRSSAALLEVLSYIRSMHCGFEYRELMDTTDTDPMDLAKAGVVIGEMALSLGVGDAEFEHRISQLQKTALTLASRGGDDD
ncbi:hypothetical protein VX037_18120 [Gordonia sp. Z-3]|uniref:hypothetical protein n=1 Tax=Gordonia sp. Z-3 TaxID=3115408 RepID=UPI002E297239|nr:hypothetical protein [Gordonia sp. Z-3]MED5802944.1 hypothetical protein [Gordonia sp. Z-3]